MLWLHTDNYVYEFDAKIHNGTLLSIISTVEPLLKDTLNKEQNIVSLSLQDKFCGPYRTMAMQFYLYNSKIAPKLAGSTVPIV